MSVVQIIIFGDGTLDLGELNREYLPSEPLSALPCLVHRLLGEPQNARYTPVLLKPFRGHPGKGSKWAKKAKLAIRHAQQEEFAAAAIVIDRDRDSPKERPGALAEGRDEMLSPEFPPCAVGAAVETFDAWMIVDGKAIGEAGGDAAHPHTKPETLQGKRGTAQHPKSFAMSILGGREELSDEYAVIALHANLDLLRKCCPKGFGPFAADVERHVAPVLAS